MMNRLKIGITTVFILIFAACSIGAVLAASENSDVYVNTHGSDVMVMEPKLIHMQPFKKG